ncbi:MAG: TIGR03936 family radical SAM-associated protein [Coriobacteriales bacterium]|nr:TIGR03936 family radical SAM-associated protein [Coriobacteriales bacterium]
MNETVFRLRVNFQKRDRLRFLSHLELLRTLERTVRRAQLPLAISNAQNRSLRLVPGPALPVGAVGLDEYFDLWLTEYLEPALACERLQQAGVHGLEIRAASYVDPRVKGLPATHVHAVYELALELAADGGLSRAEIAERLERVIAGGLLVIKRKDKQKTYDLSQAVERAFELREVAGDSANHVIITLWLRTAEQGAIRPAALVTTALDGLAGWELRSVTRTRLYEDEERG